MTSYYQVVQVNDMAFSNLALPLTPEFCQAMLNLRREAEQALQSRSIQCLIIRHEDLDVYEDLVRADKLATYDDDGKSYSLYEDDALVLKEGARERLGIQIKPSDHNDGTTIYMDSTGIEVRVSICFSKHWPNDTITFSEITWTLLEAIATGNSIDAPSVAAFAPSP